MNYKIIIYSLEIIIFGINITSCNKKKNSHSPIVTPPAANHRQIKYEITGNYSGYLLVAFYDNVSGNAIDTVKSLPWSKEVFYPNNVTGIGIGANSIPGHLGAASQSTTVKIYSWGNSVKSQTNNTDANGIINIQSMAYVFP